MFRHGKYRLVSAVAFAVILSAVSLAVFGTSSATVAVKLAPVMVSADTSTLPPDAAKAEMTAVWRLFDHDTDTAYTPAQTARITVSMPGLATLSRIRVYGASSYQLNVYRDNNGTWEPVPSLSGLSLAGLSSASWNTFVAPDPIAATYLLLEFIPQGNVTAGIREIELWGPEASTVQEGAKRATLDGIRTSQDALSVLSMSPSHILEYSASPSELPVSDTSPSSFSISLTQNPVLFKRAYIMYDGYNLVRSVSISRRINNLSWSGGFVIPQPGGTTPSWVSYIEEINPAWLVQGVNTFDVRSSSGTATLRNLKLIVETDGGWNSVSSVSPSTIYDGDTTTSYAITASASNPLVEISFEHPVQPETIRLNLPGPLNVKAGLQYQSGDVWQDVQPGWQVDLSTMVAGWNDISVPSAVSASALRLILFTDSLAPGTVVGSINEIRVSASPSGPISQTPRIVVSYPRDGEYFGRTAYIRGFVIPATNPSGSGASVTVEAKAAQQTIPDGSFSLPLTKDETRFYTQADDEAWEPVTIAEYAGQFGAYQYLLLNKNAGLTGTTTNGSGGDTDNREKFTDKVSPGQAKKIQYKGVTLDIPAGAVDQETDITIIPLTGPDLARMDPGMINVTFPDAGYRFLPHGMKFKKAIKISFGYSKQLFAAGQTDDDVQMYFYNEKFLHWEKLNRNKVDKALQLVESNSDHFTDIINSTLVVPEHAQALSFNPNSIKDIKAADPSANVNLIEPPRSNNKGTANLSYPIEVPPGRNKLQPNIAVQYNSSGGNGWMGLGWDIPLQAITIDTRWGVPRYDMGEIDQENHVPKETETYTLDGEQLAPLAHRGDLVDRTPEKIFHTRVEGQFRKIIRHGTAPSNYWWEVIDKNGTKYFYGGDASTNGPAADSVLADGSGNVFKWALRKIQDTNGNFIKYNYKLVQDSGLGDGSGGVAGYQLYLRAVQYSGHATLNPPYTVLFKRDRDLLGEPRRPDVSIDARGGFKMVTADLLRRIEIYFGGSYDGDKVTGGASVRSYDFTYQEGAFKKTLLKSVTQYGSKGTAFNQHSFSYFDEARDTGGAYRGFSDSAGWDVGSDADKINAPSLLGHGPASAIGGNTGSGGGGHIYIGVGSADKEVTDKTNTGGFKIGYNQSESEALLTMADMDGDGLPDKVFKGGDGFYYRKNLSGPRGGAVFADPPVKLDTLPAISHDNVTSTTIGLEAFPYGAPLMYDHNMGENESDAYFTDVNSDGLTDVVSGGMVWFNHLENGVPTFTLNSAETPAPIRMGTIDTNGLIEDPSAIEAERVAKFPLLDTMRRWVAPYDGTVSIDAPVRLIQDTSKARVNYTKADGVQVAIQLEGGELWSPRTVTVTDFKDPKSSRILADDYSDHTPTNVDNILVKRGDRLYFRVQSVFNGAYDQVAWDPIITYHNVDTTRTDVNSLTEYSYRASQDFTLAGRRATVIAPLTGTLHLAGTWEKTGATTDDVTLQITRNGAEVYRNTLGFADTTTINLSQDLAVTQLDELEWSILVDSPIDAAKIKLTPSAYYTSADGVDDVIDDKGKYVLQVNPPYDMDLYPVNALTAPQASWTATQTGTLSVLPTLDLKPTVKAPTKVAFTAKRRNTLLGKGIIEITRDADGNLVISPVTLNISVDQGDQLFFDFSTRDVNLAAQVLSSSVKVTYSGNPLDATDAPSAFHSAATEDAFPVRYRGWGVIGYNGNSPRDSQPVNQSLLVVDGSYDPENARVYPFAPIPGKQLWGGADDSAWVKAGEASSSRLGLKDILMPHSDKFAGASAPSRISESTNDAVDVGFGASKGESHSKIEFQDLNGDGFPDVIGNSGVQYTRGTGDLDLTTKTSAGLGSARSSINESFNASTDGAGNIAKAIANARGNVATNGRQSAPTAQQGSDMPKFGLSGGYGTADTDYDLIDINGDGLPDKVHRDGSVNLNLGYSFSTVAEQWGGGIVNNGQTLSGGVNLGFNLNHYSIAGGLNLGIDTTRSDETYVDINGDGLPDKVTVNDGSLSVRLNTGAGFTDSIAWPGGFGKVAVDNHISLGGGALITFGFKIPVPPLRIVFNPGINFSTSMGRPEVAFRDMDGDGFVEQVNSTNDSDLRVAQNQIGRTNLLKSVKRPLGGSITLEYQREGNRVDYSNPNQIIDMPQSQWTMTRSTLTDGMGNTYRTDYSYAGGYKDRFEREFYGFQTVTETHAPVAANPTQNPVIERSITQTFNNRDFYLKGLLLKSVTMSRNGHVWARTVNTYTPVSVTEQGNVVPLAEFPSLTRTDTYFYDGNDISSTSEEGFKKSTYQTFAYDSYGNVINFHDKGEFFPTNDPTDDVTATITYIADTSAYIVGKPLTIVVIDAAGKQLRSRSAVYEPGTGNLLTLTLDNTTGPSVWKMTYHTNGNLSTITDPVGYKLIYSYDDTITATHVTEIRDNFSGDQGGPYYSTASYNPLFGQVRTSTDLNKNTQANGYDEFGRLACVYGPYDAAPGDIDTCTGTRTIAFTYQPPVLGSDNALTSPASAITENRAVSVKGHDPIIIRTITYIDGMKRIIETKKDADANGTYGMTVSGKVVFDDLGRVAQQGQPVFETGYNAAFTNYSTAKNPTLFTYDTLDRTTMVMTPDAKGPNQYATTTTEYGFSQVNATSPVYATTKVVDPIGNAVGGGKGTKVSYKDVDDRIMAVVEYNNTIPIITTYEYDPLGQIIHILDDKKNLTTVEYDNLGRRTMIDNPDAGKTVYGYDANGNLASKLTANYQKGKEITYTYEFNRLKSINYPFSTQVVYTYGAMGELDNRAGRIKKVTDESGVEERYYGRLGETLKEEKTPTGAKTSPVQNMKFTTQYVFDSFGRMTDMTYPDGEALHYAYDNGGLLKAAWGIKNGTRYDYIMSLLYDEFGQRTHIVDGNGAKTDYTYDDKTRRLATLGTALPDGTTKIQNLSYGYDLVGNVLNLANNISVATNTALPSGPVTQNFGYDDLYQLQHGDGTYTFGPGKGNNYTNDFIYDTIGNMMNKKQIHTITQPNLTSAHLPKETNYVLSYTYGSPKPHAVTDDGNKLYTYDPAGNMTGWSNKNNGTRRTIIWNEENRVQEIDNNGQKTYFLYDDAGERVIKRGQHGETVYINRFYAIRNGELGTKHVFAGETRVLSKLVKTPPTNTSNTTGTKTTSTTTPLEKDQFFYHGDHLGSSNMITDAYGAVYQHLEYFPYGESWIEEGGSYGGNTPGYKFTGKELDPETGLYYFGARYYDPVLSKWVSADSYLGKYLPVGNTDRRKLPGLGGIFNPINLSIYTYTHNNPIKFFDPDGNDVYLIIWATHNGRIGHAGIAVTQYAPDSNGNMVQTGNLRYRDLWPAQPVGKNNVGQDVPASYGDRPVTEKEILTTDVSGSEGYAPEGVIRLTTDFLTDANAEAALTSFTESNPNYNGLRCNCSTFAEIGIAAAVEKALGAEETIGGQKVTTPNQLFKAVRGLPNASVIKDPGDKANQGFLRSVTGSKVGAKVGEKRMEKTNNDTRTNE